MHLHEGWMLWFHFSSDFSVCILEKYLLAKLVCINPKSSTWGRIWHKVKLKWIKACLNSVFLLWDWFPKKPSLLFYLLIAGKRRDGWIHAFPKGIREMQTVLSTIWIRDADFTSYNHDHYDKHASSSPSCLVSCLKFYLKFIKHLFKYVMVRKLPSLTFVVGLECCTCSSSLEWCLKKMKWARSWGFRS